MKNLHANLSEEWLTAGDVTGHKLRLNFIASIASDGDLWERA